MKAGEQSCLNSPQEGEKTPKPPPPRAGGFGRDDSPFQRGKASRVAPHHWAAPPAGMRRSAFRMACSHAGWGEGRAAAGRTIDSLGNPRERGTCAGAQPHPPTCFFETSPHMNLSRPTDPHTHPPKTHPSSAETHCIFVRPSGP